MTHSTYCTCEKPKGFVDCTNIACEVCNGGCHECGLPTKVESEGKCCEKCAKEHKKPLWLRTTFFGCSCHTKEVGEEIPVATHEEVIEAIRNSGGFAGVIGNAKPQEKSSLEEMKWDLLGQVAPDDRATVAAGLDTLLTKATQEAYEKGQEDEAIAHVKKDVDAVMLERERVKEIVRQMKEKEALAPKRNDLSPTHANVWQNARTTVLHDVLSALSQPTNE